MRSGLVRIALAAVVFVLACDDDRTVLLDGSPPVDDQGTLDVARVDGAPADGAPTLDLPSAPDLPPTDGPAGDLPAVDAATADLAPAADSQGWDALGNPSHDYVVQRFVLPTATTASQLGVDLNGDGVVDNGLGALLGAVGSMAAGVDFQQEIDLAVYSGTLLQLLRLFSNGLTSDPAAVLQTWGGAAQTCCSSLAVSQCLTQAQQSCFSGTHSFSPSSANPTGSVLAGAISGGQLSVKGTTMMVAIPLGAGGVVQVQLMQPRVLGSVSSSGVTSGVVAGAVPQSEIQSKVLPAIGAQVVAIYTDPQTDLATKTTLAMLFDTNGDGNLTAAEVAQNVLLQTMLSGDVDVNKDGVDELSLGMGFEAVPAVITP